MKVFKVLWKEEDKYLIIRNLYLMMGKALFKKDKDFNFIFKDILELKNQRIKHRRSKKLKSCDFVY